MRSSEEMISVLRYWLASVRLEEALTVRPKASRTASTARLNMKDPHGRQAYFKIPLAETGLTLATQGDVDSLTVDIRGERVPYTEQWLKRIYRRQTNRWSTLQTQLGGWIGWPTVYFPHNQELATLFRLRVHLDWLDESGTVFEPPDYRQRKNQKFPPPPTTIKISSLSDGDSELLPYSVDDRLLTHALGVADEELADLHDVFRQADELNALDMVATVTDLLMSDGDWVANLSRGQLSDEVLVADLIDAVRHRLSGASRRPAVYPIILVYDSGQIQTTHHLQRDLATAIDVYRTARLIQTRTPLRQYLDTVPTELVRQTMYGQFSSVPMTNGQRRVAESFQGSTFVSVQGPPGTGKTRLILDLAAAHLVQQIHGLATNGVMDSSLLVITSTNNRAVDTVFEQFTDTPIPLGLRAGSQVVTANRTTTSLLRTLDWLDSQPEFDADSAAALLEKSLSEFKALFDELVVVEKERSDRVSTIQKRRNITRRIAELEQMKISRKVDWTEDQISDLMVVERPLARLATRLNGLLNRLSEGPKRVDDARAFYEETRRRFQKRIVDGLGGRFTFEFPTPPDAMSESDISVCADWLERVEDAQDHLDDLRIRVKKTIQNYRVLEELIRLRRELDLFVEHDDDEMPQDAELALRHTRLYQAAQMARIAWINVHRKDVTRALRSIAEAAASQRSLRKFYSDELTTGRWLKQLFPVVGSTLLSIGNVFSSKVDQFERMVIDEGGQCHPAYAVSALLRCEQALVIGDVHQLEPVVQLTDDDEARVRRSIRLDESAQFLEPYRIGASHPNSAQRLADLSMNDRPNLHEHFRCQPDIIRVSDLLCHYQLDVQTPAVPPTPLLDIPQRVALIPVYGQQERLRGSWYNLAEIEHVERLLSRFESVGVPWHDIAIITPYVGQLDRLRERLRQRKIPWIGDYDQDEHNVTESGIVIGTVHRFQGGERRYVIFTTVVTNERSLHFLNERVNLVNVAISRAREQFITIGHDRLLSQGRVTGILTQESVRVM
ncbi:MAG: AAA domain-containing protein [Myxococcota bacterium]|nr:AAA domain-containing protein [Myxococcota bacterium]